MEGVELLIQKYPVGMSLLASGAVCAVLIIGWGIIEVRKLRSYLKS